MRIARHRPLDFVEDFTLPDNPGIRLAAVESRLARLLFWYGERGYEGAETEYWRRLCASSKGVLELGANIGYYTVQGASAARGARYVAVEANPESAAVVERNVALNALDNVEVVQAAVVGDDAPRTLELALPDQEQYVAPTGAYLVEGGEGITDRPASRTITVPTVRMNDLLDGVDLIKLDIEGYEANVLRAAWPRILELRPTIVVEVLKNVPDLRRILRELRALDYEVRAIGGDGLHPITDEELAAEAPLPRYGSRDVVLVPAERATELAGPDRRARTRPDRA
ncbi:FkbM family methyltransferase, partial [Planomonospora algeriensis]